MIASWLAGKLSGIIIFCMACLMPICAVGWVWEGVALHGVELPAPNFWPFHGSIELIHGALADTKAAQLARDNALKDLGTARGNEATLKKGLGACNKSIDDLAAAGKAREAAAQARVDALVAQMKGYRDRIAALQAIKPTDEKCPVVDQIFTVGAGP